MDYEEAKKQLVQECIDAHKLVCEWAEAAKKHKVSVRTFILSYITGLDTCREQWPELTAQIERECAVAEAAQKGINETPTNKQ